MNIQQLRYVVAIANSGTFREAAEKMYVSQPSLSISVRDLEKELGFKIFRRTSSGTSLTRRGMEFYEKALGLKEVRRKTASDGSFILVYMGDGETSFTLELTWLRDRKEPYDLGEGEYHLCLRVPGDYDKVRAFHKGMGCVCYENTDMGLYFICDPDGYWIEILPL